MNVHNLAEAGVEEDMGNGDFSPGTTEWSCKAALQSRRNAWEFHCEVSIQ